MPDTAPDEATAIRYAARGDKSVVVESATTETEELRANPDGSMTWVEHVQPVRVKRGGGWVPVDLTLERKADGTFGPKASTVEVAFSGGGTGSGDEPLAKVVQAGHEVGLGWSSPLPEPVVDGASLVYRNVLPDVDLKVEAHLKGFRELLVVKTAEAARNPELDRITFRTHAEAVRVEEGPSADGGLVARDPEGKPVFLGDASRMWDSSGGADASLDKGDRHAAMGLEVTPDGVSIVPDRAFLDSPATTFPVSLDPEYYCGNCGKVHHAVVQDLWGDAHNFDRTSAPLNDLKAGRVNAAEMEAHRDGLSRSYLQMHTGPIAGKYIHGATLKTKVVHTYSCNPSATELWLVDWIDWGTTWDNQPRWQYLLSSNNRENNAAHCPTDGNAGFDATKAVRDAAAGGWTWTNFMLKAEHEGQLDTSWRKFDLNPYLEVRYNSYPNPPSDLGMEGWGPNPWDALPCRLGPDRAVVGTRTPTLRARLSDPDQDAVLKAGFRVFVGPHDNYTWNEKEVHVPDIQSGNFAQTTVPTDWITSDGVHSWHLWSNDHEFESWSPYCEFEVDTVKPNTPAVSSIDFPDVGIGDAVGRTGTFTFRTNGNTGMNGKMDVRKYGWSLNNDTATTHTVDVPSGGDGTVTVSITPTKAGTNVLYVTAFDHAGNRAAANAVYTFRVGEPAVPKASWSFNESSGSSAGDDSGGNRPLTLQGQASFAPGYEGNALTLDGTSGHATSPWSLLDTSRAFSVSAWAKVDRLDGYYTVASQDGAVASPFYLQYSRDVDRWTVSWTDSDTAAPGLTRVASAARPQIGVWTHLVGSYEPDSGLVSLYVDGKLEGTGTARMWTAIGSLVIGASKWDSRRADHFPGAVDAVRVWDRVLSAAEVAAQANVAVLRARMALDEQAGTTTLEQVSGQQASLSAGVTWAGTPVDPDDPNQVLKGEDKWLNFGASGPREVTAPRPAILRTDRSYSVSAWVRLENVDAEAGAAVSLGDTHYTPFQLQYRPENKQWAFLINHYADRGSWHVALSDKPAQAGKWVHLVGIYDATSGRIALYVDGVRQTFNFLNAPGGGGVSSWNGTGPLWLGRGVWGGKKSDPWRGDVDDARVYSGVLTTDQVRGLRESTPHQ
ncbi:LamG-like jellyroll fold domain-containing protein [Saccharothrix australiensis]|uniref:LamG-like jellyroll fold domain-containing protein n=1 Tax=Saccharothrix australiensis TaxID=2072 RepID=UPI001476D723|nr:LamG-like jellyroll fold domain-containing protein [Saccharothrix australiensis]